MPLEDYAAFSKLAGLPPLVRKQRRLERTIAPIEPKIEQEKALRKEIAVLLIAAGIPKGDGVRCLGYDVVRCGKKGNTVINYESVVAKLVAGGVDKAFAITVLNDSSETGDPSVWSTVKPSKGAKVRA